MAMDTRKKNTLIGAIALGVVVLAVLGILFAIFRLVSPAESSGIKQLDSEQLKEMQSVPADSLTTEQLLSLAASAPRPAKLKGASETVDEHGVVHGTTKDGVSYVVRGRGVAAADEKRVTLAAVGDQIASDNALYLADGNAGDYDDGLYDFNPWYEETGPVIRQYDLRFINQETVMATGDELGGPSGYPSFNTPDAAGQAIADQGFNMVNFATNHLYDYWLRGIEISHEVWHSFPQLTVAGSYLSKDDRETVQMIERNGTTFAFLAYAYGDNRFGSGEWSVPNDYYNCFFDERLMAADISRAQKVADVVIVAMHWGTEYEPEPNNQQRYWAQWLADHKVDLVIGTHAHSIQPVEYYKGAEGNIVPVVFGLSDFISGWEVTDTLLSGIFTCDFAKDDAGAVKVENLVWHPTIEWSDNERTYVRLLDGMTPEEINANTRCVDEDDVYNHLIELVGRVIVQIPVDWKAVKQDSAALADAAAGKLAPGPVTLKDADAEGEASSDAAALPAEGEEVVVEGSYDEGFYDEGTYVEGEPAYDNGYDAEPAYDGGYDNSYDDSYAYDAYDDTSYSDYSYDADYSEAA